MSYTGDKRSPEPGDLVWAKYVTETVTDNIRNCHTVLGVVIHSETPGTCFFYHEGKVIRAFLVEEIVNRLL